MSAIRGLVIAIGPAILIWALFLWLLYSNVQGW